LTEAPWFLAEPARPTPVVVNVPHAGLEVPEGERPLVALEPPALRTDADLDVDQLWSSAPALGAALLVARVSRYVVDLNRDPDDVDERVCPRRPRSTKLNPRGVIWRAASDGRVVTSRPLTPDEVERRIQRFHAPYHAKLAQLLEARVERFGYAILLDAHSMPSRHRGARLPDTIPGDRDGASCDPRLSELTRGTLEAHGFAVAPNYVYRGGYVTQRHGRPAHGVHALQVELNRDLYMCERARRFDPARASLVRPALDDLVRRAVALDLSGAQTKCSEPLRLRRSRPL
jgi:N-formylglutamate amidohydrolase